MIPRKQKQEAEEDKEKPSQEQQLLRLIWDGGLFHRLPPTKPNTQLAETGKKAKSTASPQLGLPAKLTHESLKSRLQRVRAIYTHDPVSSIVHREATLVSKLAGLTIYYWPGWMKAI